MSKTADKTENKNDLFVRVKATRSIKQDLNPTQEVNSEMIAVEVQQTQTESTNMIELNIHIQARN
jgi:hypothetical protein